MIDRVIWSPERAVIVTVMEANFRMPSWAR
jgi:hypothetical protein